MRLTGALLDLCLQEHTYSQAHFHSVHGGASVRAGQGR